MISLAHLSQVGDKHNEVTRVRLSSGNLQCDDHCSNKKSQGLDSIMSLMQSGGESSHNNEVLNHI